MEERYQALFTPMHIGKEEIRNRFILCPMEGTSIVEWLYECQFNEKAHDFYIERAKDGVGLFIPGMTPLRSMMGNKWLWKNPKVFKPVKPLMDEIHSYGAKVFFQLGSGWGRSFTIAREMTRLLDNKLVCTLMKPYMNMESLMVAPDEGSPNVWIPKYKSRAITKKEIQSFVEAYAKTALLCKEAGVDGVEVHAVHEGYLMDQFTMPYTNHRTDEYGGSFENRYRFAAEVVKAIKDLCGQDYPVSLRYSVTSKTKGYNDGAVPGETFTEAGRCMEESERAIRYLEEAGYDAFNCDNGTYDAWYWAHPPVYMPLNCNLEDVMHIKQFTSKPVFCAGRMQIDQAAEVIAAGKLDGVGIGRQFLCDEQFLTKIKEGRTEDIRPCISCHISCLPMAAYKNSGVIVDMEARKVGKLEPGTCSLNPHTFHEKQYVCVPAKTPKKIAVIGGGIGGMEFAIQASRRGHHVELYEKTNTLGGTFIAASAPECKEKDRELLAWYRRELAKEPVTVHLGTEIKSLADVDAEEIVIATGGTPKSLRIPGGETCVAIIDALLHEEKLGEKIVIIGGGLAGCELAYDLACKGKKPSIVEMSVDLITDMNVNAANSMMMRNLLKFHKVPVYLESKTIGIEGGKVDIETPEGRKKLDADSVVCAIGFAPNNTLADPNNKHVHVIGDACLVSNLKGAIWNANDLAIEMSK